MDLKAGDRLFCGRAAPDKQKNAEKITFLHFFCIFLAILTGFSSLLQYLCSVFQK
jgi:hypothetical protein